MTNTGNMEQLVKLAAEMKRTTEISHDYVIPTAQMKAIVKGESVVLDVRGLGEYALTGLAHNQIAEKTEIPQKYYDRVLRRNPELLAANVNQWLPDKQQRMIRTIEAGEQRLIRALLSDRYRPLDNYDLLLTALQAFNEYKAATGQEVVIRQIGESETGFYLKALMPSITAEVMAGDTIKAGLLISNSEVGKKALSISPLVFRYSCGNDAISCETYRRNHIGGQEENRDIFTDITRKSQNETIWLEVRDIVKATLSGKFLEEKAKQYRELKGIEFERGEERVKEILKPYKFSEAETEKILLEYTSDLDKSAYGLFNAITAQGKTTKDIDRQIELERLGDKIALNLLGVREQDISVLGEGV